MGQLPEQTPANLSTLAGLRQQVVSDQTAARAERDLRDGFDLPILGSISHLPA